MSAREDVDMLMRKALDGEEMTDGELRDFGAVMARRPECVREYALLRRIQDEAPRAALTVRAPAGFAGRVMASLETQPLPSRPVVPVSGAAGWAAGLLAAGAAAFAGLGGPAWIGEMWEAWKAPVESLASEAASALDGVLSSAGPMPWRPYFWGALALPLAAIIMHVALSHRPGMAVWSVRDEEMR